MADVFTPQKRSEVMSKIRGKGNKDTEIALMYILKEYHVSGWRRNQPVFGKPDFVFPKKKVAVFVDGCFWHGCPKHSTSPKNNSEFWEKKLGSNKDRDKLVNRELRKKGWVVIRIWEHELKEKDRVAKRISKRLGES